MKTKDVPPRTPDNTLSSEAREVPGDDTAQSQEPQSTQRNSPTLNTTNLRTNVVYGTDMLLPKPENTTRLLSMNINGFRRANDFQDVLETAQALKVSSADIINFQETNINWRSPCLSHCYEKFRRVYHHARISTSSSIITYRTYYQPGGTMSVVTDDYVGRIVETGSDSEMGRWSYTRMLGKHGRQIVVVSAYQVCNQQANQVGDRTAFAQQLSLLRRNGKDCSPRKSFFDDLDLQLEEWREKNYEIIISGDLNEELGADVHGFARLSAKWDLVEIIQHQHGTTDEPPTYARGTRRLDYAFCTPNLVSSITRCGILPYSEILDSDHRALYVDFNTSTLMGGDLASLSATPVRILKSRDSKASEAYVEAAAKYLEDHRVLQRLMEVSEADKPDQQKIEAIDRDITRAMAHAIKKIRKVYTSPFSPQIKQARLRRRFYKLHLSMLINKLDLRTQLESLEKVMDEILPFPSTIEEGKLLLRSAQKYVRDMTKRASELRRNYLEEQAQNLEAEDQEKAAMIRKRIVKAEEIKQMYMKLRRYLKPQGRSSLNHVMVPDDDLPPKIAQLWRSVYDPVVLEALLIERNRKHFAQAQNTPFTNDILGMIPFSGTGPIADSILDGSITVNDPVVQLVLDNLKRPDGLKQIPAKVTLDEVTGKFKNWKESTSTSPITKRHLGHYQCLTRLVDMEKDDDEQDDAIENAKKILKAHFLIILTATKFGISLTRWQNVVNSLIEKEPGNPKIHRLRVIHLYEADYNLILGIFWARKLVPIAETQRLFNDSCYGSRPGLSAVDPVLLEELQVSISYLSRTNQVTFHNDATSCYDRIIISLANLVARRFGLPEEIARLHGITLEQMRYHISTAIGISDESYQHSADSPVYGTGQGSCASPSIWLQICSVLFDCHDQKSYGANYSSPDGTITFEASMTGFVDDTKGQTNDQTLPVSMPLQQLISRMQSDAQLWGDLLYVSGGALEISKCNYYVMHWKFNPSGIPILSTNLNTTLRIENGDRTATVTLTNDAITVAHKTLGTWKSAARDQKKQVTELTLKSNDYARTIMASPVTRHDNWTAYHAIYLPRMTYVLPTCYLSEKQLRKIEQRAISATLCKGGFVSTFPRRVVFGPQRFGGIAMRPLTIEQLIQQVQMVLKHLRCPGECHALLRIMLSWAQLGTGMGFPLLGSPGKFVPHLECKLTQSIRSGLASVGAHIDSLETFLFLPRRAFDCHIMDEICSCKQFTAPQIQRINACRLYLQATLLSDIATPCGRFIHPAYYKGTRSARINWPTLQYPRQAKPDKTSWAFWRKGLQLTYLLDDKQTLRNKLGAWNPAKHYHNTWRWNYTPEGLHQQSPKTKIIKQYQQHDTVRRTIRFLPRGTHVPTLPRDFIPVEPEKGTQHYRVSLSQIYPFPRESLPCHPEEIKHMIQQLHPSLKNLVNHVETLATDQEIDNCLASNQPIRIASDGGAIPGRASYGWIIQMGTTKIAKGKGPTHGDDPRSFRAEGYGMASALLYLRLLQRQHEFPQYRSALNMIICDNQGLLKRIAQAVEWTYTTPNVTLRAEWDVESVILDMYRELGLHFNFKHVKSHQDDDTPSSNLSLECRLNVEADRLATEYMQEDHTRRPIVALFPSAKAQLLIQGASVTRKIPQAIRFAAGCKDIQQYLRERNTWSENTLDDINWDAHGSSHSHHRPHRCYLVKLCHRHLPLGAKIHRRDPKYSPICPGCREDLETHNHYIKCGAPSRIQWRINLLATIHKQLTKSSTDDQLQETIIDSIDRAIANRSVSTHGPFHRALEAQERIGWIHMLQGYWSQEWQAAYVHTYKIPPDENRKEKNKRILHMACWQKNLIQHVWEEMIKLWKLRNDERHGWDKESRDISRREVLHYELAEIYGRKNEYPLRVQRLLRASYEVHIQETVTKLADWLEAYKGTFAITWSPD
jgi:exonuclease III